MTDITIDNTNHEFTAPSGYKFNLTGAIKITNDLYFGPPLPHIEEFDISSLGSNNVAELIANIDPEFDNWTITNCIEGTFIRHYLIVDDSGNEFWNLSTRKLASACTSYWGTCQENKSATTFLNQYRTALGQVPILSEPNTIYYFILGSTEDNYIVRPEPKKLYFMGSWQILNPERGRDSMSNIVESLWPALSSKKTVQVQDAWIIDQTATVKQQFEYNIPKEHQLSNWNEAKDLLAGAEYTTDMGYCFTNKKFPMTIKVLCSSYVHKRQLRNNTSSLDFRYWQLKLQNPKLAEEFLLLYWRHYYGLECVWKMYTKFRNWIQQTYIAHFVTKTKQVHLKCYSALIRKILQAIHKWYLAHYKKDQLTHQVIDNILIHFLKSKVFNILINTSETSSYKNYDFYVYNGNSSSTIYA